MREVLCKLLDELLLTHSPTGLEGEIDGVILRVLRELGYDPEQDAHGNILVRVTGRETGPVQAIAAHKDELGTVVRKIDPDGHVWVEPLGGCLPHKYGEGPFDLMTEVGVIPGVLSMGSTHSSALSARTDAATRRLPDWDVVTIDCRMDGKQLHEAGLRIGDRGVIGRGRKSPLYLGTDTVCGYALDDKGAVAALLILARLLADRPPANDVLLAFTACEEIGCSGGSYMAREQEVQDLIALEVAPMAEEYPIHFDARPVLLYKDALFHYDLELTRCIAGAAAAIGIECQSQVVRSFGSDAAVAKKYGVVGRAACLAFPTRNTHGYEMSHIGAIENCINVLNAYLARGQ